MIQRAILSVSDKSGLIELARSARRAWSRDPPTGGTASHLAGAGLTVTSDRPVVGRAGDPGRATHAESLRLDPLRPRQPPARGRHRAAGRPPHRLQSSSTSIRSKRRSRRKGVTIAEAIEQTDIGGPTMLRAAAKNHRHVSAVRSLALRGSSCANSRPAGSAMPFGCVVQPRSSRRRAGTTRRSPPSSGSPAARQCASSCREVPGSSATASNPRQSAAFWVERCVRRLPFEQLQGKELSYNNLLDLDAAMRLANAFTEPSAAIIKHTNPVRDGRRARCPRR